MPTKTGKVRPKEIRQGQTVWSYDQYTKKPYAIFVTQRPRQHGFSVGFIGRPTIGPNLELIYRLNQWTVDNCVWHSNPDPERTLFTTKNAVLRYVERQKLIPKPGLRRGAILLDERMMRPRATIPSSFWDFLGRSEKTTEETTKFIQEKVANTIAITDGKRVMYHDKREPMPEGWRDGGKSESGVSYMTLSEILRQTHVVGNLSGFEPIVRQRQDLRVIGELAPDAPLERVFSAKEIDARIDPEDHLNGMTIGFLSAAADAIKNGEGKPLLIRRDKPRRVLELGTPGRAHINLLGNGEYKLLPPGFDIEFKDVPPQTEE